MLQQCGFLLDIQYLAGGVVRGHQRGHDCSSRCSADSTHVELRFFDRTPRTDMRDPLCAAALKCDVPVPLGQVRCIGRFVAQVRFHSSGSM